MYHHARARNRVLLHTLLLSALFLAFSRSGWPQGFAKMDATLSRAVELQSNVSRLTKTIPGTMLKNGEAYINVFMEVDAGLPSLQEYGAEIRVQAGRIYLIRLPVANLAAVAALPEVVRLEGDAWVEPLLNLSVPKIGADRVWEESKYGNLQGEGVIAGMVDTGISLSHLDFKEEVGGEDVSRILWVLDQADGAECSPKDEECDIQDLDGHGTSVMGVMAGNGRGDCGEGIPCKGVAPKADIIVVKWSDEQLVSHVIEGVKYIFQKADEKAEAMDKPVPAVVNLSLAWYSGSRDGNSLPESTLSGLVGEGRIIVAAAGNVVPLELGHARIQSSGERKTVYLDCIPTPADSVVVYGWYDHDPPASDSVQVRVLNFDTDVRTGWVGFGEPDEELDSTWGKITIQHDEESGDARGFVVRLESGTNRLRSGQWHIETRNPEAGTTVDLWVERTLEVGPPQACRKPAKFILDHQEPESTIAPPCTANDVICVGSYNTRCTQGLCDPDFDLEEGASSFTSWGPTRDGREEPLLVAPGQEILAPDAGGENSYVFNAGTSFSAPHVAGTVALMLQADPTLRPGDVREALRSTAIVPEEVSDWKWNAAWGWGKLDAFEAVNSVASEIPPPEPHGLGHDDDICFIATAAFGDIDAPQVGRLRELRDRFLLRTSPGKRLVRFYYRWSPPIALWLKDHTVSSKIVRVSLLPLVGWSEMVCYRSFLAWVVFSVFGLFLLRPVCYFCFRRRPR